MPRAAGSGRTAWPSTPPTSEDRAAYRDAVARPFWLDRRPDVRSYPSLTGTTAAGLCIVGGGFTGLWAAIMAKRIAPERSVVLLEGETIGSGATGRNGGFLSSSITHGIANGLARFPTEVETLERLGLENFEGIRADVARFGIGCDFEANGEFAVAVEPHQVEGLAEEAELLARYGHDVELLDREAVRAEVDSPTYLGAVWDRTGSAVVDPAKLADGLAAAAAGLGVEVHERTPAVALDGVGKDGAIRVATAAGGEVCAGRVLLATSAFPPLRRSLGRYIVPVYDYVLVSEPVPDAKLAAIGWRNRQGISDTGNQFHYYRLTDDNRILWGGFEAVYRYGGPVDAGLDTDEETFAALSRHFFATFPGLRGTRFTHKWGGAIDTSSRFSVFFELSHGGRVAFAGGYTGLGVGASRFGAEVALDLLDGRRTEATALDYVRTKPVPFPPEPLRWAVVQFTRNRLAAADRNGGRLGLWLRMLDRLGLGFDS
ncbi:MAG: FAD-dependent oxidoreductase [Solirubrobacterales bacterium]